MSGERLARDDGLGRPFDDATTDPARVVAQAIAAYDGWGEIRPTHRYQANAIVKALKAKDLLADRRARTKGSR